MRCPTVDENQPVERIFLPDPDRGDFYKVNHSGVTRIELYEENGELAPVPWVAVYEGDTCVMRSAARHWIIEYAE